MAWLKGFGLGSEVSRPDSKKPACAGFLGWGRILRLGSIVLDLCDEMITV